MSAMTEISLGQRMQAPAFPLESLQDILQHNLLYPVFQPVVRLVDASIYAHEALIRGPQGGSLHTPDALLAAAAHESLSNAFEYACVETAIQTWGNINAPGRVFVNMSAQALTSLMEKYGRETLVLLVRSLGLTPRMLVLEITEHQRVEDMDYLEEIVQQVRLAGVSLALDDFGDGHSSLRLWSQLKPEIVKIDKYFTKDLSTHGDKLKTITGRGTSWAARKANRQTTCRKTHSGCWASAILWFSRNQAAPPPGGCCAIWS
jgi:EAL domain-containing protein (putative c-di-GMP-specific phosphodiesterase class I)